MSNEPSKAARNTEWSKDDINLCLRTGASMGDVWEMQDRGFSVRDALEMFTAAAAARSELDGQARAVTAEENAKALKRALIPENVRHPGRSVYSYPEGDLARPRPELACPTFWVGQPMENDVDLVEEILLINQLQPGQFRCSKSDGSKVTVDVNARRNPDTMAIEQKEVWFPTRGQHRFNLLSKVAMLKEMIAIQAQREADAEASLQRRATRAAQTARSGTSARDRESVGSV